MKNNDRFLSHTRGITLLHSIFDVLTINAIFTKNRKNRIKIKKTKFFFRKQLKFEKRQKSNVEWFIP